MEKLYSNARTIKSYVTFYKSGYLRLPARVKRTIKDRSGAMSTDIYIDRDNNQLILIPTSEGDYCLSEDRAGLRVCLYGARTCGIEPGKHEYTFSEGIDGLTIKVDLRAIQSA